MFYNTQNSLNFFEFPGISLNLRALEENDPNPKAGLTKQFLQELFEGWKRKAQDIKAERKTQDIAAAEILTNVKRRTEGAVGGEIANPMDEEDKQDEISANQLGGSVNCNVKTPEMERKEEMLEILKNINAGRGMPK